MIRAVERKEDDGIPEDVRAFIIAHIASVEQLEILLFLHAHPDRVWAAADLSHELYIAEESASRRLAEFHGHKLLVRQEGHPLMYRYSPLDARMTAVIDSLAAVYQERRVRVINLIFSKPVDHIRSFADAFKFRKKND
jgi:hypothetical protein